MVGILLWESPFLNVEAFFWNTHAGNGVFLQKMQNSRHKKTAIPTCNFKVNNVE